MPRRSKRLQMISKAHAVSIKPRLGTASKGQSKEASTSLRCYNVADKSIFVEGLQKAGLKVVPRPFSNENDPNQLVLMVQSRADASQIVKALHTCTLQGRTMHINIIDKGTQVGAVKGQLPKVKRIRGCVLDAFHVRAYEEDRAQGTLECAVARPKACTKIKVPKVVTKKQKAKKDLPKEEGEEVAMEISNSESDESKGLGEEIYKQEGGEERGDMLDDGFRPEASAPQLLKATETQSDLRGERSQIQDTAHEGERSYGSGVITSTRSSTPDDMLSALLASLDEGKDAAKSSDTIGKLL